MDGDFEISFIALNLINFCTRNKVDVKMPADLDQFGRNNSHCTIVGGKCFIQFTHYTAYGG
jgi:hypothetical protein